MDVDSERGGGCLALIFTIWLVWTVGDVVSALNTIAGALQSIDSKMVYARQGELPRKKVEEEKKF